MAHRSFAPLAAAAPQWLHRLHVQLQWMRTDVRQTNGLPLFRLAAAVLVALLALAMAGGLVAAQ